MSSIPQLTIKPCSRDGLNHCNCGDKETRYYCCYCGQFMFTQLALYDEDRTTAICNAFNDYEEAL